MKTPAQRQQEYRDRTREKVKARSRELYAAKSSEEIEKQRKRRRDWYHANKEQGLATSAAWKAANKEKVYAGVAKWRADNPEKHREISRNWYARNTPTCLEYSRTRKMRVRNAVPLWANRFFIREAYHLAKLRTQATGFKWEVDHIYPLQSKVVCGLHVEHNLQVIPATLNRSKGNKVINHG